MPEHASEHQEQAAWLCAECGAARRSTAHMRRQIYCSRACMASAYRRRLAGAENPNYRDAGARSCAVCGGAFSSYMKSAKYCSIDCRSAALRRDPKRCVTCGEEFQPRSAGSKNCSMQCARIASRSENRKYHRNQAVCGECGSNFDAFPSKPRKFCSYECFLKSGGPYRAGRGSILARTAYGAKKDANHNELFAAISKIVPVKDLSGAGFGVPDGIAWVNGGWHLFDIKNPKTAYGRKGLNNIQKKWAVNWGGGPVYLLYSVEDAVAFAQGKFGSLKRFPDATMTAADLIQVLS